MPTYVYQSVCGKKTIEVTHSMAECDNPSQELITQTTYKGVRMKRVPQLVQLAGFLNGTSVSEKTLLKDKQDQRKLRSKLEFINTIDSNDRVSPSDKKMFKKKYKNLPKKDHEKLK